MYKLLIAYFIIIGSAYSYASSVRVEVKNTDGTSLNYITNNNSTVIFHSQIEYCQDIEFRNTTYNLNIIIYNNQGNIAYKETQLNQNVPNVAGTIYFDFNIPLNKFSSGVGEYFVKIIYDENHNGSFVSQVGETKFYYGLREFDINQITSNTKLIAPKSRDIVFNKYPIFYWLQPNFIGTIKYNIWISKNENPLVASIYKKNDILFNKLEYPTNATELVVGYKYFWVIQAVDENNQAIGTNNGFSEIESFSIEINNNDDFYLMYPIQEEVSNDSKKFKWSSSFKNVTYQISIFKDITQKDLLWSSDTIDLEIDVPISEIYQNEKVPIYYWRVDILSNEKIIKQSTISSFLIVKNKNITYIEKNRNNKKNIFGTITNNFKELIPHAFIYIDTKINNDISNFDVVKNSMYVVESDTFGNYNLEIDNSNISSYRIIIYKDKHALFYKNIVIKNDESIRHNFTIVPLYSLVQGYVYDVDTGLPISNVFVEFRNKYNYQFVYTDSDGFYRLPKLVNGIYSIEISKDPDYKYLIENNFNSNGNKYHKNYKIEKLKAGNLAGLVLNNLGKPLENAVLRIEALKVSALYNFGKINGNVVSAFDGKFLLPNLRIGSYKIYCKANNYPEVEQEVIIESGITNSVQFNLKDIKWKVVGRILDHIQQPLSNVKVSLKDYPDFEVAYSNKEGFYELYIPNGDYTIEYFLPKKSIYEHKIIIQDKNIKINDIILSNSLSNLTLDIFIEQDIKINNFKVIVKDIQNNIIPNNLESKNLIIPGNQEYTFLLVLPSKYNEYKYDPFIYFVKDINETIKIYLKRKIIFSGIVKDYLGNTIENVNIKDLTSGNIVQSKKDGTFLYVTDILSDIQNIIYQFEITHNQHERLLYSMDNINYENNNIIVILKSLADIFNETHKNNYFKRIEDLNIHKINIDTTFSNTISIYDKIILLNNEIDTLLNTKTKNLDQKSILNFKKNIETKINNLSNLILSLYKVHNVLHNDTKNIELNNITKLDILNQEFLISNFVHLKIINDKIIFYRDIVNQNIKDIDSYFTTLNKNLTSINKKIENYKYKIDSLSNIDNTINLGLDDREILHRLLDHKIRNIFTNTKNIESKYVIYLQDNLDKFNNYQTKIDQIKLKYNQILLLENGLNKLFNDINNFSTIFKDISSYLDINSIGNFKAKLQIEKQDSSFKFYIGGIIYLTHELFNTQEIKVSNILLDIQKLFPANLLNLYDTNSENKINYAEFFPKEILKFLNTDTGFNFNSLLSDDIKNIILDKNIIIKNNEWLEKYNLLKNNISLSPFSGNFKNATIDTYINYFTIDDIIEIKKGNIDSILLKYISDQYSSVFNISKNNLLEQDFKFEIKDNLIFNYKINDNDLSVLNLNINIDDIIKNKKINSVLNFKIVDQITLIKKDILNYLVFDSNININPFNFNYFGMNVNIDNILLNQKKSNFCFSGNMNIKFDNLQNSLTNLGILKSINTVSFCGGNQKLNDIVFTFTNKSTQFFSYKIIIDSFVLNLDKHILQFTGNITLPFLQRTIYFTDAMFMVEGSGWKFIRLHLDLSTPLRIEYLNWKFILYEVFYSEKGLSFSGDLNLPAPFNKNLKFKNLFINNDGYITQATINGFEANLFGGTISSQSVFFDGSNNNAEIILENLILNIPSIQLKNLTLGKIFLKYNGNSIDFKIQNIDIPIHKKFEFSGFDVQIVSIIFSFGSEYSIGIQGDVNFKFPLLSLLRGRFLINQNGKLDVSAFGIGISLPAISIKGSIALNANSFQGNGLVEIVKLFSIETTLEFGNGKFKFLFFISGLSIPIPATPFLLMGIEGGVDKDGDKLKISFGCEIVSPQIVSARVLVTIDFSNGDLLIDGKAHLLSPNKIELSNVKGLLSPTQSKLEVNANMSYSILGANIYGNAILLISPKVWGLGLDANINLFNVIQGQGGFAVGYNFKSPYKFSGTKVTSPEAVNGLMYYIVTSANFDFGILVFNLKGDIFVHIGSPLSVGLFANVYAKLDLYFVMLSIDLKLDLGGQVGSDAIYFAGSISGKGCVAILKLQSCSEKQVDFEIGKRPKHNVSSKNTDFPKQQFPNKITLDGFVYNQYNLPIDNALVTLKNKQGNIYSTYSLEDGRFIFSNILNAEYDLFVTKNEIKNIKKYTSFSQKISPSIENIKLNISIEEKIITRNLNFTLIDSKSQNAIENTFINITNKTKNISDINFLTNNKGQFIYTDIIENDILVATFQKYGYVTQFKDISFNNLDDNLYYNISLEPTLTYPVHIDVHFSPAEKQHLLNLGLSMEDWNSSFLKSCSNLKVNAISDNGISYNGNIHCDVANNLFKINFDGFTNLGSYNIEIIDLPSLRLQNNINIPISILKDKVILRNQATCNLSKELCVEISSYKTSAHIFKVVDSYIDNIRTNTKLKVTNTDCSSCKPIIISTDLDGMSMVHLFDNLNYKVDIVLNSMEQDLYLPVDSLYINNTNYISNDMNNVQEIYLERKNKHKENINVLYSEDSKPILSKVSAPQEYIPTQDIVSIVAKKEIFHLNRITQKFKSYLYKFNLDKMIFINTNDSLVNILQNIVKNKLAWVSTSRDKTNKVIENQIHSINFTNNILSFDYSTENDVHTEFFYKENIKLKNDEIVLLIGCKDGLCYFISNKISSSNLFFKASYRNFIGWNDSIEYEDIIEPKLSLFYKTKEITQKSNIHFLENYSKNNEGYFKSNTSLIFSTDIMRQFFNFDLVYDWISKNESPIFVPSLFINNYNNINNNDVDISTDNELKLYFKMTKVRQNTNKDNLVQTQNTIPAPLKKYPINSLLNPSILNNIATVELNKDAYTRGCYAQYFSTKDNNYVSWDKLSWVDNFGQSTENKDGFGSLTYIGCKNSKSLSKVCADGSYPWNVVSTDSIKLYSDFIFKKGQKNIKGFEYKCNTFCTMAASAATFAYLGFDLQAPPKSVKIGNQEYKYLNGNNISYMLEHDLLKLGSVTYSLDQWKIANQKAQNGELVFITLDNCENASNRNCRAGHIAVLTGNMDNNEKSIKLGQSEAGRLYMYQAGSSFGYMTLAKGFGYYINSLPSKVKFVAIPPQNKN